MRNMKTKLLSLLLSVAMVISLLPTAAFAEEIVTETIPNMAEETGDGVMEIPTTVNWEIHSMTAYQTDEIPPPASGWPEATPTPTPTAEPTATPDIGQSDRKEVVKTDDDSSNAGYFWDVTVDLSHKSFKGVFTSETDNKTLEKTFEIGNMQGGNAVFSVILLGAPADVKATFTIE